jgi:hypothetical protein
VAGLEVDHHICQSWSLRLHRLVKLEVGGYAATGAVDTLRDEPKTLAMIGSVRITPLSTCC